MNSKGAKLLRKLCKLSKLTYDKQKRVYNHLPPRLREKYMEDIREIAKTLVFKKSHRDYLNKLREGSTSGGIERTIT